ncbi:NAD(P)/FAD-dependent oxidoreductase [Cohnella faecalis]|uniref:NAD(P)/FAD-dependent oxidoreductase n=1 Tax=Cohnella faecalis TaxID=2315694 RepID=A0A398CTH9_9BACL|nr:NAD(P)/FAD-dependent oxidoreductase [Cohnella faecalis]RIE03147.1 NAD(P)/FAD-dependent oxidoreductase [Cohnella faecalis]
MRMEYDVIIVGARVAGSALAYELAGAGYEVLLLDRGTFPSDTLSTHNIYGNTVAMLKEMGVLDSLLATGTPVYRRAHMNFEGAVLDGRFPGTEEESGCLCVRRVYFDDVLFKHAKSQRGVTVLEGFRVTDLLRDGDVDTVTGVAGRYRSGDAGSFTAKLVVGADGRLSSIRKLAGSECLERVPTDFASYVAYASGFAQEGERHVEFYKKDDKWAIAFPTSDGQFVIGAMFPLNDEQWLGRFKENPEAGMRDLYEEGFSHTTLPARVRGAEFVGPVRGLLGYDNDFYRGMGKGWAVVGDALSFKDPTIGQGMHDALFGARTLAATLSEHKPDEWNDNWGPMGEWYQSAMEKKLMSRFRMGCQLTKNVPTPPETVAAYRLIGADEAATQTFFGTYNYKNEPDDIGPEIGRLLAAAASASGKVSTT